ncbi:cytochrome P450 [Rhizoctonia solani]|nr:cytochrome P450 [Rhizoctonia solani]
MIIQREAREGAEALGEGATHDELLAYVFAGQDTTSSLLRWLVKYLPQNPEIQHRLHNEVCSVFGQADDMSEPFDFHLLDDPERVPLLEAVVAETLRCAGVGAQIGRELIQDEIIMGRFVPKGTQLIFAIALMSRDKERWGQDADEWRPTRWLTPEGAFNRQAGPSFPFGLGQRSCFGQRLAVLQVKAYTASLSQSFFFRPVPPEVDSWEPFETITRQPEQCYISLERWGQE